MQKDTTPQKFAISKNRDCSRPGHKFFRTIVDLYARGLESLCDPIEPRHWKAEGPWWRRQQVRGSLSKSPSSNVQRRPS